MRPIYVDSVQHRGKRRIKLIFDYDRDLITLIKNINGSAWSHTMKCWHIPYSDDSIEEVKKLQQIEGVSIIQLDKLLEERKFRYFDRTVDRETEHIIESYQQ